MGINLQVVLLTLAGAFGLCIAPMVILIGGLIGSELAVVPELATLPIASLVIGTAMAIIPVTRLMAKFGRKPVFIGGALFSAFAACLAAISVVEQYFWGLVLATVCLGASIAVLQQYRFAAMESVSTENMPNAASFILLGGLIAAILGPELATLGKGLLGNDYVGSFYLLALTSLIGSLILIFYRPSTASLKQVIHGEVSMTPLYRNTLFWVAIMSSTIGYAVMSYIMTATPVSMHIMMGHDLDATKWVIQSHILAMFLPSLFSGFLAKRFGVKALMATGLVFYFLCIALTLSGEAVMHYWGGLVLLGLGWNFLFVSGTLLLATTYTEIERYKAQGFHDFFVFASQAVAALSSGVVIYSLGWKMLLIMALPFICLQVLMMFFGFVRKTKKDGLSNA